MVVIIVVKVILKLRLLAKMFKESRVGDVRGHEVGIFCFHIAMSWPPSWGVLLKELGGHKHR